MILKVVIDDIWLEEDQDIDEELKSSIINGIVQQIKAEYKEKIDTQIKLKVDEFMVDGPNKYIDAVLGSIVTKDMKVKSSYSNEVTLQEYIESLLKNKDRYDPLAEMSKIVANHVQLLQDRYDIQYATHIITELRKNNLLNEQGAEKLLIQE